MAAGRGNGGFKRLASNDECEGSASLVEAQWCAIFLPVDVLCLGCGWQAGQVWGKVDA